MTFVFEHFGTQVFFFIIILEFLRIEIIIIHIDKKMHEKNQEKPLCKKIQNYIFKFSDKLGQGNFSSAYKGHHEITST